MYINIRLRSTIRRKCIFIIDNIIICSTVDTQSLLHLGTAYIAENNLPITKKQVLERCVPVTYAIVI